MNYDFTIKQDNSLDNQKKVELFTIVGKHDYIDSDKNPRLNKETSEVCAKKILSDKATKFYIKTGLYGKIYDPIGLYTEGTGAKFLAKTGKKAWEFKQVNQKVFEMYVSFLKTKNKAWLTNAERELN
jgi:hypothetical protein